MHLFLSKGNANSQQMRDLQTIKTYITSPGLVAIMDVPWAIIFNILFMLHTAMGVLTIIGVYLIMIKFITDRANKAIVR